MRIAEFKEISTRTEQRVVHHGTEHDEDGNIINEAWDETVEVEVPVMGMVYRDATPEEVAEFERIAAELPPPEPTPEERIARLETENANLKEALELILSGATEVTVDG